MKTLRYRPELDGLRALAVIAVFIYHAELTWRGTILLPGGFLGVDIFFVLSGYLITGILLERSPTLLSFYKGRIDRIYPALLLMLFFTCIAAYMFLTPENLLGYIETLKGSLGFYSNYVFMNEDTYVSDASKYKALLHTWTLGIEWQFYMLFPLFIGICKKYFIRYVNEIIIFLCAASFFYCLYLMSINKGDAFYSTPARIWELCFGGVIFLISRRLSSTKIDSYIAAFSVTLLFYIIFFVSDTDNIPGFISLIAVVATGLFILFVKENSLVYKIASYKYFVFIGLISYSLYLYHQPVLVFYRIGFAEVGKKSFLLLFLLSLILAILSYRFFEDPIRKSKRKSKYLILLLLLSLVLLFINVAINTNGYPKRQSENVRNALLYFKGTEYRALIDNNGRSCNMRAPKEACKLDNGSIELIAVGDSYVGVFTRYLSEKDTLLTSFQHEQCPLMNSPIWFGGVPRCWEVNKARWVELEKSKPTTILVGTNFNQFNGAKKSVENLANGEANLQDQVSKDDAYLSFRSAIERLIALGHHPIVLLQPPNPNQDVVKEMERKVSRGTLRFNKEYFGTSTEQIDTEVIKALEGLNITFINLNDAMCIEKDKCLTFNEHGALYNGGQHLSYFGVQLFAQEILNIAKTIKTKDP